MIKKLSHCNFFEDLAHDGPSEEGGLPQPPLKKASRSKDRIRKATGLRTDTPTVYVSRAAKGGRIQTEAMGQSSFD